MNRRTSRAPLMRAAGSSGRVARQSDSTLKDVQSATPAKNDTGLPVTPSGKAGRTEETASGHQIEEGHLSDCLLYGDC